MDVDFGEKTARVTMEQDQALLRSQCDEAFSGSTYTVLEFSPASGASDGGASGADEAGATKS